MRTTVIVLVVGLLLLMPDLAAAELVTNGDFETGTFTNWTTTPATGGSNFGVGSYVAHTGTYHGWFGASAGQPDAISQTLATTPGELYTLAFFLRNEYSGQDSFKAVWDGTTVIDITPMPESHSYTQHSYTVAASGSATLLEFRAYDAPSKIELDDVSVTVVPEPTSLVLLAAASAVGGALRFGRFALFALIFAWRRPEPWLRYN
jgi:hypothetical protein